MYKKMTTRDDLKKGQKFVAVDLLSGKVRAGTVNTVGYSLFNYHPAYSTEISLIEDMLTRWIVLYDDSTQMPEFWPPEPGDVWKSKTLGYEYHVQGDQIYSEVPKDSQNLRSLFADPNLYVLVHRKGRVLGIESKRLG